MQRNTIIVISWGMLVLAVLAWAGVMLFGWFVLQMLNNRDSLAQSADQAVSKQASDARMRALARDTIDERAALDMKASTDALTAVNVIESIGKAAGVTLRVRDAQKEKVLASVGQSSLQAVGIVVSAEGSFSGLIRAVEMLETLPLPTSIDELDIGRAPVDEKNPTAATWSLNARVRLLTTSEISP